MKFIPSFFIFFAATIFFSSVEAQENALKIDIVALKENSEIIEIRQKRIEEIKEERNEIYSNIIELEKLKIEYAKQIKQNEDKIESYLREIAFIKSQVDNNKIKNYYLNYNTKFEIVMFDLGDGEKLSLIKYHVAKNDTLKSIAERTYDFEGENDYKDLEKRISAILQINNLFNVKNNLSGIDIIYIPFFK